MEKGEAGGSTKPACSTRAKGGEAGEEVEVLASTNAAARLIQGCTVHAFVTRVANGKCFVGPVLIDEVSMLSLALVAVLDQLRLKCKIVSFGD